MTSPALTRFDPMSRESGSTSATSTTTKGPGAEREIGAALENQVPRLGTYFDEKRDAGHPHGPDMDLDQELVEDRLQVPALE